MNTSQDKMGNAERQVKELGSKLIESLIHVTDQVYDGASTVSCYPGNKDSNSPTSSCLSWAPDILTKSNKKSVFRVSLDSVLLVVTKPESSREFMLSPSKFCLLFTNAFSGLFTRRMFELNPEYFRNVPSGSTLDYRWDLSTILLVESRKSAARKLPPGCFSSLNQLRSTTVVYINEKKKKMGSKTLSS